MDPAGGWAVVDPVIDLSVRKLCTRRYRGHPRGCPNYGQRLMCPPKAQILAEVLDLTKPVYCVWNRFDLAAHVAHMRERHPAWTRYQLRNCLYWQPRARKTLRARITDARMGDFSLHEVMCPEARGVNVTATMKALGIELEWPPEQYAYQVALLGTPKLTFADYMKARRASEGGKERTPA